MLNKETKAEKIQEFIEMVTDDEALRCIEKDKGMQPMFVFLLWNLEREENNYATFDMPKELMNLGRLGKDLFMKEIFPKMKEKMIEDGHEIIAIAFCCEAWKSDDPNLAGEGAMNETNSQEILMMSIHYEGNKIDFIYPIMRIGENFKLGTKEVMSHTYESEDCVGRFSRLM